MEQEPHLPPCRPADTPTLLRWLRQHYGPGQALGQGQFLWQGSRVSVVYEPLLSGPGVSRRRAAGLQVQGVVGVLSTAILAQAQADRVALRALK